MKSFVNRFLCVLKEKFVLFLLAAVVLFFGYLFVFKVDANVKIGVMALLGSVCVAIYTHAKNREREVAARLFPEKKAAYDTIFKLIFYIMFTTKYPVEKNEEEDTKRVFDLKRQLMVWGSSEAIACFNNLEVESTSFGTGESFILKYEDLVKVLRKDLGHDDSKLKSGQLVGLILTAEDKAKLIGA